MLPWHLYVMAFLYVAAGLNHFRNPKLYVRIIPPYFPNPKGLNIASGALEVVLGIALCVPLVSAFAAWGIIALLIAVFPANIYMYMHEPAGLGIARHWRLLRLPVQALLILWAWAYT